MNRAGIWHGSFFRFILHCFLSKNKDASLWNFFPNSGLRKLRHGSRLYCRQNSSTIDFLDRIYDSRRVVAGHT